MVNEMGSVGGNESGLGEIVSKQSREPLSTAEGGCRTVVVALGADGNGGTFDNVRSRKSRGRKKVEKDIVNSGESTKTDTGRPSRKCKKISDGIMPSDLSFFEFAGRGRRSLFYRPRISDWGSPEIIDHIFEQIADADLNRDEHEKSREDWGIEEDAKVKLKNNQRRARSQRFKKEIPASTSRIRLKVTFGRSCSSDIIPSVVDEHRSSCHTQIKSLKCTEDIKEKFEERIYSAPDGHDEVATQKQVELLEAVDSRCLEPGTSPDSEVINMIPDSQTSEKIAEDDILDKEICAVSGEVSRSTLPVASSSKGIKKNILCQDVNCSTDDKPPSPEIIDGTQVADQHRHLQITTNDAILRQPYMSITTGNISAKTSSSGVSCGEPPFQSSGVPDFGDLVNEGKQILGGGLCSPVRSQLESLEKCVPSIKPRDHINTNSSGSSKSRLECSQAMPWKASSDEQKEDLSDLKARENSDHVQAVFKSEIYTETGTYSIMN